jgi:integrase
MAILPRIKIHEIRHTNNTWLLDENQSIFVADIITKRLGRSSLKVILDNYYHSNSAVEDSIVEKIKI